MIGGGKASVTRSTVVRFTLAVASLALIAAAMVACDPNAGGDLKVSAPEDVLGLSSRLVFSSNAQRPTDDRVATLTNTGNATINVTDLTISGQNAGQFLLVPGQAKAFSIAPNTSKPVRVRFRPTSAGNKFGTLTVVNNSSSGNLQIALRGVRAISTLGNTEPQLQQLMQLFGYATNVGFTKVGTATTPTAFGDEVLSPYWNRADSTQPVTLTPIAKYTGANFLNGATGRTPFNSATKQLLYRFPPDEAVDETPGDGHDDSIYVENQKTFPQISDGTFSFSPTAPFGLYANNANFSDDRFNRDSEGQTFHNFRFYPAKGPGGAAIPNVWIVAVDVNVNPPDKNYDYQDQVMLLKNAQPAATVVAPKPGASALNLSFSSAKAGTIADKDGQGTGFTSVQGNKNGSQYKANLIDLANGHLKITSTAGRTTGADNTQNNALQLVFDASSSSYSAQGRILGPMSDLTAGFQQKAVFAGPDQDNYIKIEIEHRTDKNGVFITVLREINGASATIGQVKVNNPGSVSTLDLGIVGTRSNSTLQARYKINGGTWTNLGTAFKPGNVNRYFASQSFAGILVSNTGTTQTIVGTYDSFSIT
jgi:hypothetical protein